MADLPKMWDKMSTTLKKRWWAAHGGGKPFPAEEGGRSAAAAKRSPVKKGVKTSELSRGERTASGKMSDVRRENIRRMKAAMERGTASAPQKTSGASGSGAYSPSSMKDIRAAIKSGAGVRTGLAGHSNYDEVLPEKDKKKMKEEVEQVDEVVSKIDTHADILFKKHGSNVAQNHINQHAAVYGLNKDRLTKAVAKKTNAAAKPTPVYDVDHMPGRTISAADAIKQTRDVHAAWAARRSSMKKEEVEQMEEAKDLTNRLKKSIEKESKGKHTLARNKARTLVLRKAFPELGRAAEQGMNLGVRKEEVEEMNESDKLKGLDYNRGHKLMYKDGRQKIVKTPASQQAHKAMGWKERHSVRAALKSEELEQVNEGNPENKAKKNAYMDSQIQRDYGPDALPSRKYARNKRDASVTAPSRRTTMMWLRSAAQQHRNSLKSEELKREFDPEDENRRDMNHPDSYKLRAPEKLRKNPKFGGPSPTSLAIRRALKKEEVEQVDENTPVRIQRATHENPLVTVHRREGGRWMLVGHMNLDTAKNIYRGGLTFIRARHVHEAGVGKLVKSADGIHAVALSKHHAGEVSEEVEQMDEVNARHSFVAAQAALTPKASDVKAAAGKTARDKARTNKYARRISKLTSGEYSKQDVKNNLKSLAKEEVEQVDEVAKWRQPPRSAMQAALGRGFKRGLGSYVNPIDNAPEDKLAIRQRASNISNLKDPKTLDAKFGRGYGKKHGQDLKAMIKRDRANEEVEYIEEKLTAADPAGKWISDFVASDNPKFEGMSNKERMDMALGAYYAAQRSNEEVVQEKLDPVGGEDKDIDNDGDHDNTDRYLRARRQKIGAAIAKNRGM